VVLLFRPVVLEPVLEPVTVVVPEPMAMPQLVAVLAGVRMAFFECLRDGVDVFFSRLIQRDGTAESQDAGARKRRDTSRHVV
jgi:hypothetical protein